MNFKRLGSVVCVGLIAGALVLPPRQAQSYTIFGGLGGGSGSAFSGAGPGFSLFVFVATLLGIYYNSIGTSYGRLSYPYAPDQTPDEQDPFRSLAAYAGRNKPATDAYAKMYTKAPPQISEWSGFYVNANIGYGDSRTTWRDTLGDIAGVAGSQLGYRGDGVLGGVRAGYEMQRGQYIFGIEGEFSGSGIGGNFSRALPPAIGTFRTENHWIASVTPRIGVLGVDPFFGRTVLAFVKGGVAFAEYGQSFVLNGALGPFIFPEQKKTSVGWTVGFGTETALGKGWWVRSDTSYYDFGREQYAFGHPVFGPARTEISNRILVSTIGLTYRFR